MTIEHKRETVTDQRYIMPIGGVLNVLFRRPDAVTGISLVPNKNHPDNDSVIVEIGSRIAKLLVGPEIASDPVCREHKITWRP